MDISQAEIFRGLIDTLLSDFWVILLFGFLHFGIKNHSWLSAMVAQGHKKKHDRDDHELMAVVHGAKTMAIGVVVVICSYMIASLVFFLLPSNPALPDTARTIAWQANIFQISVAALIIAGYSLILSAGSRWLTFVAKLIATLTILVLVGASVVTYL